MPPLELRTGLNYTGARWSAGALWRIVTEQDRYALNQGNIGRPGSRPHGRLRRAVAECRLASGGGVLVTAGVDNLFDKLYAEHLSRGGAMVAGFEQTTRVNEPGRNAVAQGRRLARLTVAKPRAGA